MSYDQKPLNPTDIPKNSLAPKTKSKKYYRCMSVEDLDNGLCAVGSNNFYQIILVLSFLFLKISSASYVTSLPFYLKEPNINCFNETEKTYSISCSHKEVCLKEFEMKHNKYYNPSSTESFYQVKKDWKTFFTEYDILCSTLLISLFACTDSISYILSTIFSSLLADNIGRRKTILINCFCELIFRILVLFATDKYISFILFLGFNLCGYINVNTINSYICEMTDKRRRGFYVLLTNSWSSLFGIIIAIIFNTFSSWHYIHYSTIVINFLGLFLNVLFLKESVKYSFLKKNFQVLFETFEYMSNKNNRKNEYLAWKESFNFHETNTNIVEALEKEEKLNISRNLSTFSRLKCIFNKDNIGNFLIVSTIMIIVGAAYSYNGLDMRNTSNFLVNPIIFFLSDFIVVVSAGALIEIPWIGRKKPVVLFSFLAAIFFIIKYIIISNSLPNYSVFWIDIVLRFCININFYVLTVWSIEIYPFDISMLAANLNRLSSRIGRIYSPIVLLSHRKLMTFQLCISMWISSIFLFFLTDTTGMIIKESSKDSMETKLMESLKLSNGVKGEETEKLIKTKSK